MNEAAQTETSLQGAELVARGKVRDVYRLAGDVLLVATDRVSAYDVVFDRGIPGKGEILTRIASFWFDRIGDLCPHHLLSTDVDSWEELDASDRAQLRGRTMRCQEVEILPVEWVVRGHLTGSGFRDYQKDGIVSGVRLPEGLEHASRLETPVLTPSTKAASGHDEPISFDRVKELVGESIAVEARRLALALFERGREYAAIRGLVIADTKFEFGMHDGHLVLADECLTPDSSRYWRADEVFPGAKPQSFDKQVLRDWAVGSGWDQNPPAPALPDEIVESLRSTYELLEEMLTGD